MDRVIAHFVGRDLWLDAREERGHRSEHSPIQLMKNRPSKVLQGFIRHQIWRSSKNFPNLASEKPYYSSEGSRVIKGAALTSNENNYFTKSCCRFLLRAIGGVQSHRSLRSSGLRARHQRQSRYPRTDGQSHGELR